MKLKIILVSIFIAIIATYLSSFIKTSKEVAPDGYGCNSYMIGWPIKYNTILEPAGSYVFCDDFSGIEDTIRPIVYDLLIYFFFFFFTSLFIFRRKIGNIKKYTIITTISIIAFAILFLVYINYQINHGY